MAVDPGQMVVLPLTFAEALLLTVTVAVAVAEPHAVVTFKV